jgi:predicted ATPase
MLAELARLEGTSLAELDDLDTAEERLGKALTVSRAEGARMYELHAAVDLGKLLARRGRQGEARALLAPIFATFTEGLGDAALTEARSLLERW